MKPFKLAILHIGGEKTGTTRLQKGINEARDQLAGHGIHVPLVTNMRGNCWGFAVLGQHEPNTSFFHQMSPEEISHTEACESLRRKFEAEFQVATPHCDTLLVSSEHLQTVVNMSGIRRLLEWLGTQAEAIRVVYVARRQDQIIRSLLTTIIRGNAHLEPLLSETPAKRLESPRLNHWLAISRYLAFPQISVVEPRIIAYGTGSHKASMDQALTEALQLPSSVKLPTSLTNAALSERTIRFMSTLLSPKMGDLKRLKQKERREITSVLKKNDDTARFMPPKSWAKNIVRPFDPSNQRVQETFMGDGEIFYERGFANYPENEAFTLGMSRDEFHTVLEEHPELIDLVPELKSIPAAGIFTEIQSQLILS